MGVRVASFQNINTDISKEDKHFLLALLSNYSTSFVEGTPNSNLTTRQMQIRLIDPNCTVQRRPYRLSLIERQVVRDKVKELITAGTIRPSCLPVASPMLLVKKKDGSDRMRVDYRELNSKYRSG